MSLADIRRAERELENLRRAEAEKHLAALKELGYDVSVAGARTSITTKAAPRAPRAPRDGHRGGDKKLRGPAYNKRDIAGPTRYREILAALPVKETAEILVPDGFDVGDILGPVYGGAHRQFGAGNYTLEHDDHTVLVTRHA